MKSMKRIDALNLRQSLQGCKVSGVGDKRRRRGLACLMVLLNAVASDFEAYRKECVSMLDGSEVQGALEEWLDEESGVVFPAMTDVEFEQLMDANPDMTLNSLGVIGGLLCCEATS